ncbi:MAG: disulfide bond formation protein B [Luteimonas sp.]
MNPLLWSFRVQCLAGFAVCALLLGYAVFLQLHDYLVPCPLCIFQRVAFAALGLALLMAGLHAPRGATGRRAWGMLALLAAIAGIGIAGRHVWLQHLPPDQVPMCGPGLEFLTEAMPLSSVIRTVLTGSGECARIDWTLLGLSMPEWSLLWFALLAAWVLATMFRHARH